MRRHAEALGLNLEIDSAGTGSWHIGNAPDRRAIAAAAKAGVDISNQRARQITKADFERFDLIIAMDNRNLIDARRLGRGGTAKIQLLLDYLPGFEGEDVADPYFGNDDGFTRCWRQVDSATQQLAQQILHGRGAPSK